MTERVADSAGRWTFAQINQLGADQGFLPQENRPRLVIIESPYAGDIEANTAYARAAMRDSLERGEYPIASHLLYTQPGILDEHDPKEREWGIRAGLAWRSVAHAAVFYTDRGWSLGMLNAAAQYDAEGFDYTERTITSNIRD